MWIHHLTHIENLKSILENGLKPRNELKQNEFKNTANNEIITKREEYKSLNDYIPFHINKLQITYRIPYNYVVCKNEGNENMIFLSCKTENLFSDEIIYQLYHPVSNYKCEYVSNNEKEFIKKLEEEENKLKYEYNFNYSNPRVKEFLMSEILVKGILYLDNNWKIYVYSNEIKNKIKNHIENNKIDVLVNPTIFS
jgi:putative appr-1-p processing domain-containing protein